MNPISIPRVTNAQEKFYDVEFEGEFPFNNYFVEQYACIPCIFRINDELKTLFVEEVLLKEYELIWKKNEMDEREVVINQLVFKKEATGGDISFAERQACFIKISYNYDEFAVKTKRQANGVFAEIVYSHYQIIEELIEKAKSYVSNKQKGGNISLVIQNKQGLATRDYPIKGADMNIELNYGKKFMPVYDKIVERLNEERGKGIVLLHGVPGTGKTSLIKYITTQIKKEVLFIPPALAGCISEPSFIDFLMHHSNSVLVIEDAEQVILDREGMKSNAQGVSNILNLTDGILSDCLGIQIMASFNTSRDRIDKALLRKGRLIAEYMFNALPVEETNALLRHLNKKYISSKAMTLTDIYNLEEEVNVVQQDVRPIGFTNRV